MHSPSDVEVTVVGMVVVCPVASKASCVDGRLALDTLSIFLRTELRT